MNMTSKLKEARDLVAHLEGERMGTEDVDLKEISERILPHRGYWPSEGDNKDSILQRGKKNINPAGMLSLERAAGGLTTGMTPEGQPWFGLRTQEAKLMEEPGVREHLGVRERLINAVLRAGGFYQEVHVGNIEMFGFGGILLFEDSSDTTLARFEANTVGTYCVAHDTEGELDIVTRRMQWSAMQIKKKFGEDKMSKRSQELLKSNKYTKVDVVHVVSPREDYDDTKIDNLNMKYESILYEDFLEAEDGAATDVLRESGYHEMPYFYAPYAKVGSSEYGMGAGHLLIEHSKQLDETERQKIIALQKMINPPTKKPAAMKGRLNVGPAQENIVSATDAAGLGPLYEVPVQAYQSVLQEVQDLMQRIAAVAKADLFYDLPAEMRPKDMTATEYMERKRERLQQVAPFVSIYEPKILDKIITRTNNMLDRVGMFPEPPPALVDAGEFEVEYISSVAKALRQVGAESTRALMADVGNLAKIQIEAGMKPTALMKVDIPQAVDELANGIGAPARLILDDKAFEKQMAEDAEQEAKAAQEQQAMDQAEQLSKVGGISTQGTVAGAITEEVGQ
jgi:hypothetical protein